MRKRKKLLNNGFEEIKKNLNERVIDAFDCMAKSLEELEAMIVQAASKGYSPVRKAQVKIKSILDYLSESDLKLQEKDITYFKDMYDKILKTYNLVLDRNGMAVGGRIGRFIQETTSSSYSKNVVEDPFRSFRIR